MLPLSVWGDIRSRKLISLFLSSSILTDDGRVHPRAVSIVALGSSPMATTVLRVLLEHLAPLTRHRVHHVQLTRSLVQVQVIAPIVPMVKLPIL